MDLPTNKSVAELPSQELENNAERAVNLNVPAPAVSVTAEGSAAAPRNPIIRPAKFCLCKEKSVVQLPSQGLENNDKRNNFNLNLPAPVARVTTESCANAPREPIIQQAHSCLSKDLSSNKTLAQLPFQGLENNDARINFNLNFPAPVASKPIIQQPHSFLSMDLAVKQAVAQLFSQGLENNDNRTNFNLNLPARPRDAPEGSVAAPRNPTIQQEHPPLNYRQQAPHLNHPQQARPSLHHPQQAHPRPDYPQQAQPSPNHPQQAHLRLNHPQQPQALPIHFRQEYLRVDDPQQANARVYHVQQFHVESPQPPRPNRKCSVSCGLEGSEILQALLGKSLRLGKNFRLGKSSCERMCPNSLQLVFKAYYKACSKINANIKNILTSKKLIDPNININIGEDFLEKFRPLHFAVKYQLLDTIKILIENGIDVNATDFNGLTALHYAVEDTQLGLLQDDRLEIRIMDTDLNGQNHGSVQFFPRLFKILSLLVKSGSDVNAKDRFGRTPIFYLYNRLCERAETKSSNSMDERPTMCSYHYLRMVNYFTVDAHKLTLQLLISHRLDYKVKDRDGNTILHLLAKAGDLFWKYSDTRLVKAYVKSGGDVNALNNHGFTALHYACSNNFADLVKALLRYGADVNLTTTVNLERPIHCAVLSLRYPHCRPGCTEKYKVVERLLRHGADVDAETTGGMTPILMATDMPPGVQNRLLLMCLLNWGCNVNCADTLLGETPLHHLCRNSNIDVLEIFLQRGADVNALDYRGETPFTLACKANERGFGAIFMYAYMTRLVQINISTLCPTNATNYTRYREKMQQGSPSGRSRKMMRFAALLTNKNRCRAEQELMKTVRLDKYASLYDILVADWRHLVPRAMNDKLTDIICDQYFDEDYPTYAYLLKYKIARAKKRAALVKPARDCLRRIINADLSDSVYDGILEHVDNKDLMNLIGAVMPKKIEQMTERKSPRADDKRNSSFTTWRGGDSKRPRLG